MKLNKEFLIPFVGLKQGKHQFEFDIDKTFFDGFQFDEYNNVNIKVNLVLEKKSTMMELTFKHKGFVNVPCDITNEDFDLPVKGKLFLLVKFGEEFNNDNDEILILPHGEYQIDVSQYIYEMIVLSVPTKRIHPGVKDGSVGGGMLDKLDALAPKEQQQVKEEKNTDPRWDGLKKLLTDNK
ncbi:YceD family protein [Flavobacterium sp. RHBU_3]|uniref:YceD family protein n=1 Tax=Flavobacterium sp. RHBU_3 TaxID=3391184 RepID=UPI0039855F84